MRIRMLLAVTLAVLFTVGVTLGATKSAQSGSTPSKQKEVAPSAHPAMLVQLMRGTLFLHSNVVFASQGKNPEDTPPAKRPSASTDPLAGTYGKWEAVENSSLAIIETADLLTVPTRVCSNGRPVPTMNADWPKLVQGLRDAGWQSYQAAKLKDQDKMADAAEVLTTACGNCHVKYRDHDNLADRCK
jgi:hypothetical protein